MWQTALENLLPLAVTILTPVLMLLVNKGLNMMAKKWNLQSALVYEDKVDELILKGIKAAEQKSLAALKKGGERTPGEKKLDDAMKFVNAQLRALKLDEKASNELSMLVESKLFDGAKEKAPAAAPST